MARPNVPPLSAENVEKTSGLPLPKARKVTPAVDSFRPRYAAIVERFGQKKSDAEMPMNEKRKTRTMIKPRPTSGFRGAGVSAYHRSYGTARRAVWRIVSRCLG
jgi:hypothetical protein